VKSSLYLREQFSLDLRALALMRIGLALVMIIDLLLCLSNLTVFYTDEGVLPLSFLFSNTLAWNPYYVSLHTISGSWHIQVILFTLTLLVYFLFAVGYKTRLMTLLSWILLVSMQNRNILIDQGGDHYLRLLLFWTIFLPTHHYYSIDALRKPIPNQTSYVGLPMIGYLITVFGVYFFSIFHKTGGDWQNGEAVYYALSLDMVTYPSAQAFFFQYPELMKFLSFTTYYWEMLAPFLLFIPFGKGMFRLIFWFSVVLFHGNLSLCFMIGIFLYVPIVGAIGVLPAWATLFFDKYIGRYINVALQAVVPIFFSIEHHVNFDIRLSDKTREVFKHISFYWLLVALLLQLSWKLQGIGIVSLRPLLSQIILTFRFDQTVGMFAPIVFRDDGWYIAEATSLQDSMRTDIWNHTYPVSYQKPSHVPNSYRNDRWRKYLENYLFINKSAMRPYFCSYLLRKARSEYPEKLFTHLDIIYMKEVSVPYGKTPAVVREVLCSCEN